MEHTFPILFPPSGKLEGKHNDEWSLLVQGRKGWKKGRMKVASVAPEPPDQPSASDQDHYFRNTEAICLLKPLYCFFWKQPLSSKCRFEPKVPWPQVASLETPPRDVCSRHPPLLWIPLTSCITDHVVEHFDERVSLLGSVLDLRENKRWYPPGVLFFFFILLPLTLFSCFYLWELLVRSSGPP